MNCDFAEMLNALTAENVEFLVVGAYAVAGHGGPRADPRNWPMHPGSSNLRSLWRQGSAARRGGRHRRRDRVVDRSLMEFGASAGERCVARCRC